MGHGDGEPNEERAARLQIGSFLVNVGVDGEGQEVRHHHFHDDALQWRQGRVEPRHAIVLPDQFDRRQRLRQQDGEVGPGALTDAVANTSRDGDVPGQTDGDTDGRVDVATARAGGAPHDETNAEASGQADLHDARVLAVERRIQAADDEEQKERGEELDGAIAVEAAALQLFQVEGSRQLIHHRLVVCRSSGYRERQKVRRVFRTSEWASTSVCHDLYTRSLDRRICIGGLRLRRQASTPITLPLTALTGELRMSFHLRAYARARACVNEIK